MSEEKQGFKFELGASAKSTVTGVVGIISARIQYHEGTTQYLLKARVTESGTAPERWENENLVELIKD